MKTMVYMFLADGFEETEALATLDILRRADICAQTVGITGKTVTGAHNIKVEADLTQEAVDTDNADALILPGGLNGTKNLDSSDFVKNAVKAVFDKNKYICAICAAPMVLGKMNILVGKEATCYSGFEKYLSGAKCVKKSVVKSGNIITADGMGSSFKFGFEIAAALKGKEVAEKIKSEILY